jgi:DNA-binding MarR family transcriptional regulator
MNFQGESMTELLKDTARELLDFVPPLMRVVQKKWKKGLVHGVTHSQFLMLMFIQHHPGTALQDVAYHIDLTAATTSTTIEELVTRGLVLREPSQEDRRKVALTITAAGEVVLEGVYQDSRNELEEYLSSLTSGEQVTVLQALQLLAPLFVCSKNEEEKENS